MRTTYRLLVCSECGELDNDETVCGFCESEEGVTMLDVVPADYAVSDDVVEAVMRDLMAPTVEICERFNQPVRDKYLNDVRDAVRSALGKAFNVKVPDGR